MAVGWIDVPPAARWLGLGGLVPFFAGAVGVHLLGGAAAELTAILLVGYGAVILSFMGGCRWGLASAGMGQGPALWPLGASVVPALYGWIAVMAPWPVAPLLLAVGFVALYGADRALTAQGGAPEWWPALRLPLTAGAAGSLTLAALA